ncbi:MAG: HAMP domain-containing histidine kinase [Defluviitaleaceae bacterium]|nr:HAMP domain-containing histidine kinase [Defluviitaleaceae bacterium]
MIKKRFFGIFGKIFLYTMLILLFVIGGMFFVFSSQIQSTIALTQQRQFSEALMGFVAQTQGKPTDEIVALTEDFHRWNTSFELRLISEDGEILFKTEGFAGHIGINEFPNGNIEIISGNIGINEPPDGSIEVISGNTNDLPAQRYQIMRQAAFLPLGNGLHLQVDGSHSGTSIYREILGGAVWVFGVITLVSLLAAFIFARQIARPIQRVSSDTHMMSKLLPVDPPKERGDEIGQLSKDVYAMYTRLKSTVYQLETEIERVKQMKENQRHFFSAASHELKTPITAVGGIFEGMLSDVITPEEYPVYLREGIKLVKEQNKLVSEILELVKLGGDLPSLEKEPVNLLRCVEGVLKQLSSLIESKKQLLTIDVADNIICELNDRLFSRVLSNVLLNAAQNSTVLAEIRIAAKEEPGLVRLTVWNGDAEIPERIISKIYEPFYRADEARTTDEGRSGLGLTIAKKALDLMEIAFEIKNADSGVLFQMSIPIE